jgi:hypothetical protein
MIDLDEKSHCICKKHQNTQDECIDAYTIREKGKSVKLTPKTSSENSYNIRIRVYFKAKQLLQFLIW